ncbi:MAG: zinc ribbon domain-containing protein, partial [Thermoplasmata archaeon]
MRSPGTPWFPPPLGTGGRRTQDRPRPPLPRPFTGLTLQDRVYDCPCGLRLDRDLNAARNILARALAQVPGGTGNPRLRRPDLHRTARGGESGRRSRNRRFVRGGPPGFGGSTMSPGGSPRT